MSLTCGHTDDIIHGCTDQATGLARHVALKSNTSKLGEPVPRGQESWWSQEQGGTTGQLGHPAASCRKVGGTAAWQTHRTRL